MQYTDLQQYQQQQQAIKDLQKYHDPEHLWECILAFQGYEFQTVSGLPFTYQVKKARKGAQTVPRHKALGDIRGVSYLYGMFYQFGLIEIPSKHEDLK